MQMPIINKKIILAFSLAILIVGATGIRAYYNYKKTKWLEYKQLVENQKAKEITVRLIEGWNNKEFASYLEKQEVVKSADFLNAIKNFNSEKFEAFLPTEAKGSLQGFLYPDTYRLFESITDRSQISANEASRQIIEKLLSNFQKKLPSDAKILAQKNGLTLYETIILASILEKETGRDAATLEQKQKLDEERKIVAGIFYNRLKRKMALESDATVNYATGKNLPSPTLDDIKINSPYNTYKKSGLPPGPICNPSLSSINAVLNPSKTDYFYFLHKQPSGEVVYSKTFEEHIKNKFKYLK